MKTTSKTAKTIVENKTATKQITTAKATDGKITVKKVKNSIPYQLVIDNTKAFKCKSLFRVLDHLNKDEDLMSACGLTKDLTIDDLKELCPEYTALKYDKKGKVKTKLYSPFLFARALRAKYGVIS